jgi:hypothetical protein
MATALPTPITAYVEANARLDLDGMLAPFAQHAVVSDDGGRHVGRDEIRAWIQTATIASRAVFTPETWRAQGGAIVVDGRAAGDFPGSPIRFSFRFTLDGDRISELEVA